MQRTSSNGMIILSLPLLAHRGDVSGQSPLLLVATSKICHLQPPLHQRAAVLRSATNATRLTSVVPEEYLWGAIVALPAS
jgi:hypothetical protein